MKTKILFLLLFLPVILIAQKHIIMEEKNGVYYIPCKLNGIPMKFVFDTGATNVTISKTEALFLIKQGLIDKSDIIRKTQNQLANGEIEEGTLINIKEIEIDGILLRNIKATIINNESAPLLLGQSALKELGKISIIEDNLIIENQESNINKNESLNKLRAETVKYYNNFLSQIYNEDDLKVICRIEEDNLKIILFVKDNVDDSKWSNYQKTISKETVAKLKSFAFFAISKFICNTEEKSYYFKQLNFINIIFCFQNMLNSNGYNQELVMSMFDYNNLQKPYTELEFVKIVK